MILDSEAILKREREEKEAANREKQHQMVENQQARDAETLQPDAGRDRTDLEQQIGRPLQRQDIVKRLQKLVPGLYYEQSKALASRGGIYAHGKFLCGMEHAISPEFSVMQKTEQGHGRVLMRGWRSILATLIQGRYITVEQAESVFGTLKGAQSERWWTLVS